MYIRGCSSPVRTHISKCGNQECGWEDKSEKGKQTFHTYHTTSWDTHILSYHFRVMCYRSSRLQVAIVSVLSLKHAQNGVLELDQGASAIHVQYLTSHSSHTALTQKKTNISKETLLHKNKHACKCIWCIFFVEHPGVYFRKGMFTRCFLEMGIYMYMY